MFITVERFGKTYTWGVAEGFEESPSEIPTAFVDMGNKTTKKEVPEICVIDAVEAMNNLLRCVFPEIEGHHLELVCEHENDCDDDEGQDEGNSKGTDSVQLDKN